MSHVSNKNKQVAEKTYTQILKKMYKKVGKTTTYNDQLIKVGKQLFKHKFMGVFASDKIPNKIPKGYCFIINVDKSNESGSHWIAVCKDINTNQIWVYDSFGRNITKLIPNLKKKFKLNLKEPEHDAEQKESQTDCGARCLAFIYIFLNYGPSIAKYI